VAHIGKLGPWAGARDFAPLQNALWRPYKFYITSALSFSCSVTGCVVPTPWISGPGHLDAAGEWLVWEWFELGTAGHSIGAAIGGHPGPNEDDFLWRSAVSIDSVWTPWTATINGVPNAMTSILGSNVSKTVMGVGTLAWTSAGGAFASWADL
jgi:hypothetical protein